MHTENNKKQMRNWKHYANNKKQTACHCEWQAVCGYENTGKHFITMIHFKLNEIVKSMKRG